MPYKKGEGGLGRHHRKKFFVNEFVRDTVFYVMVFHGGPNGNTKNDTARGRPIYELSGKLWSRDPESATHEGLFFEDSLNPLPWNFDPLGYLHIVVRAKSRVKGRRDFYKFKDNRPTPKPTTLPRSKFLQQPK